MKDEELIKNLIPLWHSVMAWAKEVLVRSYKLDDAKDILGREYRGKNQIPGTNWFYRTHGIGVDVFKTPEVGGIDFDFGKDEPDEWRLKIFFEKQFNDGQLPYADYQHLADDEERLEKAIKMVLSN
ncbi:hypothetical protein BIZ38_17475 [Pseudoalteromonas sp. BZK2]|uniref:DUF6896 domain-containing protein n=2 Tax=Pseudoalteromonas TaxID=53246 RepID=UPI00165495D2|nr:MULTISPECIES: hypothetical protein [unclassified Pseudoalteromonas]MBC7010238.1 hypothetical protein [Pseudoalteromonas sp. BZK2]